MLRVRTHRAALVLALVAGWALVGLFGPAPATAQAAVSRVIVPLAGTGSSGAAVAGPALASPLNAPSAVAVDPAGDVLIADPGENLVLRVAAGTGTLSVLAGTGTAGAPVAGPATASPLDAPSGVAVDSAGDVFIADSGNHVVEEVAPDGTLSVVAGSGTAGVPVAGPALASPLGAPSGVAVDAGGDLYVADAGGTAGEPYVEKITPSGGLSILAGNGTVAQPVAGVATASPLRSPTGIAVDGSGNVFIADPAANVVEKVTAAGTLSVFVGRADGTSGTPWPGRAIWRRLNHPSGVAVDATGNVYIADADNNRVEEVTPGGWLSILAGNGATGRPAFGAAPTASPVWTPTGVAVESDGVIDLALLGDHTVDRLQPPPPVATAAPVVSGAARQGQTLTASPGRWTGTVTGETYRWEDCNGSGAACTAIAGATDSTYVVADGDVAHTLRVVATAAGPWGASSATSSATAAVLPLAPVVLSPPQITGTATDRDALGVTPGTWSGAPASYSYQWQTCNAGGGSCANVGGATTPSYALGRSDVGTTLRVAVTAVNAGGRTTVDTAVSAVVAPATVAWANVTPPSELGPPIISGYAGGAVVGQTLSCSPGRWTGAPTLFSYFWSRGDVPIADASSSTYTITTADRGYTLTCSVVAANGGGAIQADAYGVGVPGRRAGVPPLPTPPRTGVTARAAGVTRAAGHRRAGHRRAAHRHRRKHTHRRRHRRRR